MKTLSAIQKKSLAFENDRLAILEVLRGVAAISVALFHFTGGMDGSVVKKVCSGGWLGVEVFFVVSGFVLPYAFLRAGYDPRRHYGLFLAKRFFRLYPAYVGSVVVFLGLWCLSAILPGFRGELPQVDAVTLISHAIFLTEIAERDWIQPVYWTLAIEFQFYLIIGLISPFVISSRNVVRGSAVGILLAASLIPVSSSWVIPYLPLFVLGILALHHLKFSASVSTYVLGYALAAGAAVMSLGFLQATVGLITALTIAFVRIPSVSWLVWPGAISYSLYLMHLPFGARLVNFADRYNVSSAFSQVLIALLALAISMVGAYCFYLFVEMPSQRFAGRVKYNRHQDGATSGEAAL